MRGLFDSVGGWVDSAADYASGAAGTAATGGDLEDVPDFVEPEEDLSNAEFGEGMYASSEDGDMSEYGSSIGGAVTPSLDEQADAVWSSTTIGETYDPDAGTYSSAAKDAGWQAGYNDGFAGKAHGATSKPPATPGLAAVYSQGYAEGYVEGTQDRLSGNFAVPGGGGGTKPVALIPKPSPGDDPEAEPGMSNGAKLAIGLGLAAAVGAVVIVSRKRRKAA